MTNEYVTEAVVLDKEPIGESDTQVFLYTRDLGLVTARAISARKITSKLNSHLEPLDLVQVRLVEKNRFQVVDALKTGSLPSKKLKVLHLIKDITAEADPDAGLWSLISSPAAPGFTEEGVLRILGFDRQFALCQKCELGEDLHFSVNDLAYFCSTCRRV